MAGASAYREPGPRVVVAAGLVRQMRGPEAVKVLMMQFGISQRQAYRDCAEARGFIAREFERVTKPEYAAMQLARLERLADQAERAGQFRAAIAAVREQIRITGTAAPTKGEVEHKHTGTIQQIHRARMVQLSEQEVRLLAYVDREEAPEPVPVPAESETEH